MINDSTKRLNQAHNKPKGFTLIELIVTIGIVSILVAIAVPSFQETVRRNRIDAESQRIFITLNRARNNALTTNSPSFVCRSSNAQSALTGGISCRTGTLDGLDWRTDLLVYTTPPDSTVVRTPNNRFANQRIQVLAGGAGSNDIRRQMLQNASEAPNVNIVATANRNDFVIRFDSNGSLRNQSPFRIGICDSAANSEIYGKLIEVNASGQITMFSIDIDNPSRNCTPDDNI